MDFLLRQFVHGSVVEGGEKTALKALHDVEFRILEAKKDIAKMESERESLLVQCLVLRLNGVSHSEVCDKACSILLEGITKFHATTVSPENRETDDEEAVPFQDTDEYADFSLVEEALDVIFDLASEQEKSGNLDLAAAVLLRVSCIFAEREAFLRKHESAAEVEEMKEELASQWESLLENSPSKYKDEVSLWRKIFKALTLNVDLECLENAA